MQRFITLFFICLYFIGYTQESSIDFVIKNVGVNVDGHFNTFAIQANISKEGRLERITSTIEVKSIETGIDSRDEHILKEDYFDAEKHKSIALKSTKINKLDTGSFEVVANLTIKGKTKTISIPVMLQKIKGYYKITANFEINRKDFGVGGGSFVLGKTVKITVVHYQDL
ncbi:hypothetical protein BWZ20_08880 [Winogradskyella sp. J14-2]|uniref:YceI family protein n=1 Tax=Winogradskyella sp. J14-2 TaxID=1936080 RepID=UPI000972A8B5|nr:YceI family protein [Winogradskyella sp. J14-2]APY08403.1 hypothetical protein BWZ20_08880 [Winogradskyella sp. J14-2]